MTVSSLRRIEHHTGAVTIIIALHLIIAIAALSSCYEMRTVSALSLRRTQTVARHRHPHPAMTSRSFRIMSDARGIQNWCISRHPSRHCLKQSPSAYFSHSLNAEKILSHRTMVTTRSMAAASGDDNSSSPPTTSRSMKTNIAKSSQKSKTDVEEEPLDSETINSAASEEDNDDVIQISFPLQMPKTLSPSSAAEFKNCPQSYFFQYILKIRQPTNEALAKGTMCHSALEQLFDLKPADRTLDTLHNLMRQAWAEARDSEPYNVLFKYDSDGATDERDLEAEKEWGTEALRLLSNYYKLEDPRRVKPDPVRREMWVKANLSTNCDDNASSAKRDNSDDSFLMRGIIDRLDLTQLANGDVGLRVTDYKTGKAPNFKYSPAMNKKIADEAMWQLKIYALLLREMNAAKSKSNGRSNSDGDIPGVDLRMLRLLYLNSVSGQAQFLDLDLGETQEDRDVVLNGVHSELSGIWKSIQKLINAQDPTLFEHCDRKFCFCHKLRPKFEKGALFEH